MRWEGCSVGVVGEIGGWWGDTIGGSMSCVVSVWVAVDFVVVDGDEVVDEVVMIVKIGWV